MYSNSQKDDEKARRKFKTQSAKKGCHCNSWEPAIKVSKKIQID